MIERTGDPVHLQNLVQVEDPQKALGGQQVVQRHVTNASRLSVVLVPLDFGLNEGQLRPVDVDIGTEGGKGVAELPSQKTIVNTAHHVRRGIGLFETVGNCVALGVNLRNNLVETLHHNTVTVRVKDGVETFSFHECTHIIHTGKAEKFIAGRVGRIIGKVGPKFGQLG